MDEKSTAQSADADSLQVLRNALRAFAAERDWGQFHSPKNLAIALSVEAAELLEHFQWSRDGSVAELGDDRLAEVREELADVLLYLIRLADKLDVDLFDAGRAKIALNSAKYPVDKSRGNARKYTRL